jgi:hypothetical protein
MSGKNSISKTKQARHLAIAGYIQKQYALNPNFAFTLSHIHKLYPKYSKAQVRNSVDYFTELELVVKTSPAPNQENIFTVEENASWAVLNSQQTDPESIANARFNAAAIENTHHILANAFGLARINQPNQ